MDASPSLQAVLTSTFLETGDEIRVAGARPGVLPLWPNGYVYNPEPAVRTAFFEIKDQITIKGGYAGLKYADFGADNADARDVDLFVSILSGDIGTVGDNSDNSYHVLLAANVGDETLLDGFTITEGTAAPIPADDIDVTPGIPYPTNHRTKGGGLYLFNSHMNIVNCTFTGNFADPESEGMGGAAAVQGGRPGANLSTEFINCTFTNNTAGRGGAIAVLGDEWEAGTPRPAPPLATDVTMTNCLIVNNIALKSTGGETQALGVGGGVFLFQQVAFGMQACTISENEVKEIGAAILMECIENPNDPNIDLNTFVVLENCIIWENSDKTPPPSNKQVVFTSENSCLLVEALAVNTNIQGGITQNDLESVSVFFDLPPQFESP